MHQTIRSNIQRELQNQDIAAYLALTPANFYYTSGHFSDFLEVSRQMMGTDMVLIPADSSLEPVMIVGDYQRASAARASGFQDIRTYSMWMEIRGFDIVARTEKAPDQSLEIRPEQFDPMQIARIVADVLIEWGAHKGQIATDLNYMQMGTHLSLSKACSTAQFVDFSDTIYRLRAIKHPEEIRRMRFATDIFEHMTKAAFDGVSEGYSLQELNLNCDRAAIELAAKHPEHGRFMGSWTFNSIGDGSTGITRPGDLLRIDAGARIEGYYSDCARVALLGTPSREVKLIDRAMHHGYAAAVEQLKPGNTMRMVFDAAVAAARANGLPNYSRGHIGHSIGLDDLVEEPPFIGPNDIILQPGMVLCLELPYYPEGIGGYNIEDLWLITDTGAESMNSSSRDMVLC